MGDGEAGATEDVDSEVAGTTDSGSDGTLGDGDVEQPVISSAMHVAADAVPVASLNKLTCPPPRTHRSAHITTVDAPPDIPPDPQGHPVARLGGVKLRP